MVITLLCFMGSDGPAVVVPNLVEGGSDGVENTINTMLASSQMTTSEKR
jgi:hypothetical protein